jgi:hypothetical protein
MEVSDQLHVPAVLPPVKQIQIHFEKEAGWATEPVCMTWRRENSYPYRDSNSGSSVIRPIASRYTDCTILAKAIEKSNAL